MAHKTCEDCGCRIYEYGCVNCNEADYIVMQDEWVPDPEPEPLLSRGVSPSKETK
jgi:hypothetical protein